VNPHASCLYFWLKPLGQRVKIPQGRRRIRCWYQSYFRGGRPTRPNCQVGSRSKWRHKRSSLRKEASSGRLMADLYIDILRWFWRDLFLEIGKWSLIFAIFSEVIFQRDFGKLKLFTAKSRGFLADFHNNSGRMVGICWIWKGPLIAMWFSMGKHGHLGPNLEWWYSPLNGHFELVLNVGNGWVAGGCWDDYYDVIMDHSRKFPAFSTSKFWDCWSVDLRSIFKLTVDSITLIPVSVRCCDFGWLWCFFFRYEDLRRSKMIMQKSSMSMLSARKSCSMHGSFLRVPYLRRPIISLSRQRLRGLHESSAQLWPLNGYKHVYIYKYLFNFIYVFMVLRCFEWKPCTPVEHQNSW
jgi:hypothetical protein